MLFANGKHLILSNTVKLDLLSEGVSPKARGFPWWVEEEWSWTDLGFTQKETKDENFNYCSGCCKPLANSLLLFLPPTKMHLFAWLYSQKTLKTCNLAYCWQFLTAQCVQMLFYLNQLHGVTAWSFDFGALAFFLIKLSVHLCHMLPWIYAAVFC